MNRDLLHLSTLLAAGILCVLCLALPVYQWASIPHAQELKILAGAAALALAICKLTFIPLAVKNWQANKVASTSLFIAALFALAVSVSATSDLLQTLTSNKHQLVTAQSAQFKNAQTELNTLNDEIETLTLLIAEDARKNFRERATQNTDKLQKAKAERQQVFAKLEYISQNKTASALADFGEKLDLTLGQKKLSLKASTGAAILLHLACIFAVLAVGAWKPQAPTRKHVVNERQHDKTNALTMSPGTKKATTQKPNATELTERQLQLAQRIERGEFGSEPVMRDLISATVIPGGHKRIKPVFDYLEAQNKLRKHGNGYQLVQTTI